jgi:hypothetical protein
MLLALHAAMTLRRVMRRRPSRTTAQRARRAERRRVHQQLEHARRVGDHDVDLLPRPWPYDPERDAS